MNYTASWHMIPSQGTCLSNSIWSCSHPENNRVAGCVVGWEGCDNECTFPAMAVECVDVLVRIPLQLPPIFLSSTSPLFHRRVSLLCIPSLFIGSLSVSSQLPPSRTCRSVYPNILLFLSSPFFSLPYFVFLSPSPIECLVCYLSFPVRL